MFIKHWRHNDVFKPCECQPNYTWVLQMVVMLHASLKAEMVCPQIFMAIGVFYIGASSGVIVFKILLNNP